MIQCSDCEFFVRGPAGQAAFRCDPFANIKEPECLQKWQVIKIDMMVRAYQATLDMYRRLAPLQEKMFRQMEREIDDIDEAEKWKRGDSEDEGPETGD
jgi:hypothetical protein